MSGVLQRRFRVDLEVQLFLTIRVANDALNRLFRGFTNPSSIVSSETGC